MTEVETIRVFPFSGFSMAEKHLFYVAFVSMTTISYHITAVV